MKTETRYLSSEMTNRIGDCSLKLQTGNGFSVTGTRGGLLEHSPDVGYLNFFVTGDEGEALRLLADMKEFCESGIKHIQNNKVFKECLTIAEKEANKTRSGSTVYGYVGEFALRGK